MLFVVTKREADIDTEADCVLAVVSSLEKAEARIRDHYCEIAVDDEPPKLQQHTCDYWEAGTSDFSAWLCYAVTRFPGVDA